MGLCEICNDGKEYKNIGSHQVHCRKKKEKADAEITSAAHKIEDVVIAEDKPTILQPSSDIQNGTEDLIPKTDSGRKTSETAVDILERPWLSRVLHRNTKKKEEKKAVTVEEMMVKLPVWSIKEREPLFKPKNKNNSWIQVAAFSRTRPPKFFWAEYDGISVSVGDMFFPAPHDIRGKVFPYDMDKGVPLLENSEIFKDMSYWNKLVERVKNMYYMLGLVNGAGDFTKNIGLILLLVAIVGLIGLGNLYMSWQIAQGFAVANSQIGNVTQAVNQYMLTHP